MRSKMGTAKIAVSIDEELLQRLDEIVKSKRFTSRSRAIQSALKDSIDRITDEQFDREVVKFDPEYEKSLAEEGMFLVPDEWPEY